MQWKYTLSEPVLGAAEIEAVTDCIRSGWLSMGPRTAEFEERFAALIGARHAIAVSNGTAALHLALAAIGVGGEPGNEVVQPSINFVAAANMTKALGASPVFADIVSTADPTVSPADIERKITARTKAVVVMHYGGYRARLDEIVELCASRGIPIIEDACHAPAQRLAPEGRFLGTIGRIGCFSFFSNKNMTTGEGGMVTTDDDELAARMRLLRSHGMTTLSWDRHRGRASTYDVVEHGFNYRTDDLHSALGLAQLDRLEEMNARRRQLASAYAGAVKARLDNRAHYLFGSRADQGTAHLAGVVVAATLRDRLRADLAAQGIQSSLHYPPIHRFSAFAGTSMEGLPASEAFADSMITLPMHAGLSQAAIEDIVEALAIAMERND